MSLLILRTRAQTCRCSLWVCLCVCVVQTVETGVRLIGSDNTNFSFPGDSSWWGHSETLSHPTTGRRRFLHRSSHHIQVSGFLVTLINWCQRLNQSVNNKNRTLQELVEHYSKDSDGLCVNLCKPCVQVTIAKHFGMRRMWERAPSLDMICVNDIVFSCLRNQ